MSRFRSFGLSLALAVVAACATGGVPTAVPTSAPSSSAPVATPQGTLDPSRSDAGVVARVTLVNDTFGNRTGTYDVVGVAADGSDCSPSFDGTEYSAVAWVDDAPNGQIHRFSVSVNAEDIPETDGTTAGIDDGRVSLDFVSETMIGTQYTGDATQENRGSSIIDVTRIGPSLVFDFEAQTYVGMPFHGQVICAEG